MSDIFISYASVDRPRVEIIAKALEQRGWSVWWDRHIPIGKTFAQVIEEQLQSAKCVVVLWSQTAVKSDWVHNEAAEGQQRGVLVPALIEDVKIPFEFRRRQAARLIDWQGDSINPEFNKLLKAIEEKVGDIGEREEGANRDAKVQEGDSRKDIGKAFDQSLTLLQLQAKLDATFENKREADKGDDNTVKGKIQKWWSALMESDSELSTSRLFPPLNVFDSAGKGYVIKAEVPGINPYKLHIHADGQTLTISGEREETTLPSGSSFHRHERRGGVFTRSLQLPPELDLSQIKTGYERGILTMRIPIRRW